MVTFPSAKNYQAVVSAAPASFGCDGDDQSIVAVDAAQVALEKQPFGSYTPVIRAQIAVKNPDIFRISYNSTLLVPQEIQELIVGPEGTTKPRI